MKKLTTILTAVLLGVSALFAEDLIIDGETVYLAGDQYFDNVIITNNGVLALVEYGGSNEDQGLLRLYCDSLYIDETSSINGNGDGGKFGSGSGGQGQYGDGEGSYSGGGGGSFGGSGGIGGGDLPGEGGEIYGNWNQLNRGSRGGYGIYEVEQTVGSGGGGIYIGSRIGIINGVITSNGTNGSYYSGNSNTSSGGGSGGMIWLEIDSISLTGGIFCIGGDGYDGCTGNNSCNGSQENWYCGAGGGGGGRISIVTESLVELNLLSIDGGYGGDSGNGYPGIDGEDGVIYYLKIWLTSDTHPDEDKISVNPIPVMDMNEVGDIYGYFYEIDQNPDGIADNMSTFTQSNSVALDSLADGDWYFHSVPMDSSFNLLDEQHMTYHLSINAAPLEISSPTHPNQNYFYNSSNPVFNIETFDGIDEYYYILDENSNSSVNENTGTYLPNYQLILPGISEGTHYLHVIGYDDFGYTGSNTSHFQVNIGLPQATIDLSDDSLNFGEVYTTSNLSLPLTIFNMGNGDLEVTSISLNDDTNFTVEPNTVDPLGEDESAELTVTFHPQDTLNYSATLTIQSNDPNNSEVVAVLSGSGAIEPVPEISVEPNSLAFGNIVIGYDSTQTITIFNLGDSELVISAIGLSNGEAISINPQFISDPILPDSIVTVDVTFNPNNVADYIDTLTIHSNDAVNSLIDVPITGSGINPPIQLSIPELEVFANDTVLIPINIVLPTDLSIHSFLIELSGGIQLLDFIELETDSTLMGINNWTYEINDADSLLLTASAGADEISGEGTLVFLKFHIPDTLLGFVPINITDALFDTGETGYTAVSGGFNVIVPEYGDVDINGEIQPYDASLILQYLVNYIELDYHQQSNADVSLDNTVSALDASLILQYTVGLIDTLPYDTTMGSLLAFGDIEMQDGTFEQGSIVDIPVYLSNGENILSFETQLGFDPDALTFTDVVWSDDLDGFTIESNISDSQLLFAGAGSLSDGENNVFATLQFTVNESFGDDETMITMERLRFNENEIVENVASSTLTNVLSIDDSSMPLSLKLNQNYPNPFNPVTSITYQIAEVEKVNISVFNISGQLVEDLVNEQQVPGSYSVDWNASDVSSGMYFLKLTTGNKSITKKILLLK